MKFAPIDFNLVNQAIDFIILMKYRNKYIPMGNIIVKCNNAKHWDNYLSASSDFNKMKQAIIEGRIQELEYMVEHASIISEESSDTVKIGSSVVIRYDDEDDLEEYKIVGSTEADPFENKISNESPIAKALLGKKKGTKVTVESPNGEYEIELVEIK